MRKNKNGKFYKIKNNNLLYYIILLWTVLVFS